VFTFDVLWEKSDIHWASRWDAYLKMNGDQVHWFSILNSIMVITFLAGMVFVILLRSVHRDLAKIEQMDKAGAAQMAEESGWKLVVGDVFRTPPLPGVPLRRASANGVPARGHGRLSPSSSLPWASCPSIPRRPARWA